MSDNLVLYEIDSATGAALLTINRADKRNALSRALIADLTDAFTRAKYDPAARSVILSAAGPVFCAGMDLAELRESLDARAESTPVWDDAQRLANLYDLIYTLPKPTIAAVNGPAVAGGAGLVTVCDLAVAAEGAKVGYPEVRRGLVAAMVMPHLLRHVGERMGRYLLLTGELIETTDAQRAGFFNAVVPVDQVLPTAKEWARACAEGGPSALAMTKDLLHRLSHQAASVEETARASAAPRLTDECRQGLTAFFDKKPVPWAPR
jgi:methylglutaconyl-CoA hydratase